MDDNKYAYSVLVSMTDKDKRDEFLKMAVFWVQDNCDDDSWAISSDDGQIDYYTK